MRNINTLPVYFSLSFEGSTNYLQITNGSSSNETPNYEIMLLSECLRPLKNINGLPDQDFDDMSLNGWRPENATAGWSARRAAAWAHRGKTGNVKKGYVVISGKKLGTMNRILDQLNKNHPEVKKKIEKVLKIE